MVHVMQVWEELDSSSDEEEEAAGEDSDSGELVGCHVTVLHSI